MPTLPAPNLLKRGWRGLGALLWAVALLGLPLTSFPLITRLSGSTVAPFSAIPCLLLALLWLLPYLFRRGKLPAETVPYLVFCLYCSGLAAFSFFDLGSTFRERGQLGQTLRTFVPFSLGLVFFLLAAAWPRDARGLRRSLQLIHLGGAGLLVWCAAQWWVIFRLNNQYPPVMDALLSLLATQFRMEVNPRLSGLAWEPSWLAHQLNMLYLPLWLAASYQRRSVFPRLWKISLENLLLGLGLLVFYYSTPRIGGLACLLMLLFLFLKFNLAIYRWIAQRLARRFPSPGLQRPFRIASALGLTLLSLGLYAAFGAGLVSIASQRDPRIQKIAQTAFEPTEIRTLLAFNQNSLFLIGRRFAFLERTVYWMTGWHIFNDHPILGVGLGNAGYYFTSEMPAAGWSSTEVRNILYEIDGLPNIKSMWFRLLAETGLTGFALFVTWLLVLWNSAQSGLKSPDGALQTLALAGQLALLAYVFEGFSVDTFGLPYLFFMAGLVASSAKLLRAPV